MLTETFSTRKRKSTAVGLTTNRARRYQLNVIMACASKCHLEENLSPKFCCLLCTEGKRENQLLSIPTTVKTYNPSAPPIVQLPHSSSSTESTQTRHRSCSSLTKIEPLIEKQSETSSGTGSVTKNINRYFDSQPLSVSTVLDAVSLLTAAENLMVSELISICLEFILQNLDKNNVLYVYYHLKRYSRHNAGTHEDENLRNELLSNCLQIIDMHAETIIQCKYFTKLDSETVKDIISRKTLKVSSKQHVLEALDRWASCNCNCCQLLNQSDFLVLGEQVTCSHLIVPKESSQNRIPLKTISNINTDSVNASTQNNHHHKPRNQSQVHNCVHNRMETSNNSSSPDTIARKSNTLSKRKTSTSKKVIHGLNDILGYAIKIFD